MNKASTDILIVGGGAAGLSAALSASGKDGASVTILDDNPNLGGQIWRAELGKTRSSDAGFLIDALDDGHIQIINNAQVFASDGPNCLLASTPAGSIGLEFKKLIIATGARERFLPFPGWTLPDVLGAGGLQALVKGGLPVNDKRIVVAGTGPLLLAVAEYLRSKGSTIVAIAEQASSGNITRFARRLWQTPSKLAQAAALRAKLIGVPYLTDCWITSAAGSDKLEAVDVTRKWEKWTVECDYLACGFHLVPNTELASMLGCEIESGFVAVDEFQRTSLENIYCAGEPTGIGGVEAALVEGKIAGIAASGELEAARRLFRERDQCLGFADKLNETFALRRELKTLADDQTIVCRCEDVAYGPLKNFHTFRDAKLQTRCGMGPCQGRVCGPATQFMFGWAPPGVRPPIFPVRIDEL
jgi:NADPH-dependent 2,4-dienoyl-CoA reductase/sulfur reductase-like enzyme